MGDLLQSTDFKPLITHLFSIRLDEVTTIDLQLVNVTELGEATGAGTRTPFSLYFLGPVSQQYLQQHTYAMENDTLGMFDIFIVPLGTEAGRMRYEAIFT